MRWALATALAGAALVSGIASADVVEVGECTTPGWTWHRIGHGGTCGPTICTTDGECGGGHCQDVARCTRTRNVDTGQGGPESPPETYEEPVDALCAADGACSAAESHCTHERECSAPPSHGMCAAASGRASAPPWLLMVVGLGLAWSRRWRRRTTR